MLIAIWDEETIAHIAANDVSPDEVDYVLTNFIGRAVSRSSDRPIVFGFTPAGRQLAVVYEPIDAVHVYPITAFEV
jgi:hypothetical protein